MPNLTVEDILQREPTLPARPEIVASVLQLTRSRNARMNRIAQAIAQDPGIAARVLRMANSSLYGFPCRVTTLDHAVVLLGMDTVRDLVVASAIIKRFEGADCAIDMACFWRHSFAVGILARLLTRGRGVAEAERQFLYGLLHDTGKLLLATVVPEEYRRATRETLQGRPVIQAERACIGVDHTQVGSALFAKWGLPIQYSQVARFHHDPRACNEEARLSVCTTHLANALARAAILGDEDKIGRVPTVQPGTLEFLRASPGTFPAIIAEASESLDEAAEALGVNDAISPVRQGAR